jgi:hypothetical protein
MHFILWAALVPSAGEYSEDNLTFWMGVAINAASIPAR